MIENGLRQVDRGANPVLMREGIEKAAKAVSEYILSVSKKVESSKDIANVATISSGSEEIGKILRMRWKKYRMTESSRLKNPKLCRQN